MSRLTNRDFLKETDFTSEDLIYLLDLAAALKKAKQEKREPKFLLDKNIVPPGPVALLKWRPMTRVPTPPIWAPPVPR